MAQFKIGDRVERVDSLVPIWLREGVIIRVIPNKDSEEWFTEYEVEFGFGLRATFYEMQLRPAKP